MDREEAKGCLLECYRLHIDPGRSNDLRASFSSKETLRSSDSLEHSIELQPAVQAGSYAT